MYTVQKLRRAGNSLRRPKPRGKSAAQLLQHTARLQINNYRNQAFGTAVTVPCVSVNSTKKWHYYLEGLGSLVRSCSLPCQRGAVLCCSTREFQTIAFACTAIW